MRARAYSLCVDCIIHRQGFASWSADAWSSRENESYVSGTISTIDLDFNLLKKTIFFRRFDHRHFADHLRAGLVTMIYEENDLDPTDKLLFEAAVNDGGADLKAASQTLVERLDWCTYHNIHRAVQAALTTEAVKVALAKMNLFIKAARQSPR